MRAGRSGRLARAVLVVAVALASVLGPALLAGCTAVRNDLGTSNSDCYLALPAASAAVRGAGRLEGVRLVPVGSLRTAEPALYAAATSAPAPAVTRVCLVVFTGSFTRAGVSRAAGRARGKQAVVELAYPSNRLLATLLDRRAPLHFAHSHIGTL